MTEQRIQILPAAAALSAAVAIAVGAVAAHGITDPVAKSWLQTGVQFQLPHAVAVFALLGWRSDKPVQTGCWALLIGSVIFAGTLDGLAFGAPRWFGAVTPVGGLAMILGWLFLAVAAFRPQPS